MAELVDKEEKWITADETILLYLVRWQSDLEVIINRTIFLSVRHKVIVREDVPPSFQNCDILCLHLYFENYKQKITISEQVAIDLLYLCAFWSMLYMILHWV